MPIGDDLDRSVLVAGAPILHGRSNRIVNVIHAYHTAELIPRAELPVFDDLGHFRITTKAVPAIGNLLQR